MIGADIKKIEGMYWTNSFRNSFRNFMEITHASVARSSLGIEIRLPQKQQSTNLPCPAQRIFPLRTPGKGGDSIHMNLTKNAQEQHANHCIRVSLLIHFGGFPFRRQTFLFFLATAVQSTKSFNQAQGQAKVTKAASIETVLAYPVETPRAPLIRSK